MAPEHFTGLQIITLMESPELWSILPDGTRQVEKAGITATGLTRVEAAGEWGRKFAAMIATPKPA
jgi:hypothetical protein